MSGPSRIYAFLFYLLMYFDVCQNEILIKCHAVRNKLERQYSNSDEWSDIRPDFYFWANLTLKIGNRAWTVKNWNFHNCCTIRCFFFIFIDLKLQKIPVLWGSVAFGPTRLFGVSKLTTHFLEGIYAYGLFTAV